MDRPVTWRALLLTAIASVLVTLTIVAATVALLPVLLLQKATNGQEPVTSVNLPDPFPFRITMPEGMTANVTNPLEISVPVKKKISVPIRNRFSTDVRLDTRIPLDMTLHIDQRVPVRTTLELDTEIQAEVFGVWLDMPVKGNIPLNIDVPITANIPIQQSIPLELEAPVTVQLDEVFTVPIDTTINSTTRLLTPLIIQPDPTVIGLKNGALQWPFWGRSGAGTRKE